MGEEEKDWEVSVAYKCNICGFFESRTGSLSTHSFEEHCSKKFYCHICGARPFESINELAGHIDNAHSYYGKTKIVCPLCFTYFVENFDHFTSHIMTDHWTVKPVQSCLSCNYKTENDIESHINSTHKGFKCSVFKCEFTDGNVNTLLQHILDLHFPKIILYFSCLICEREFDEWNLARNHLANSHSALVDDNPNKYVTNSHVLLGEIDNNKGDSIQYFKYIVQLRCNLCKYICQKRNVYMNHMEQRHTNFNIKCPFKQCKFRTNKFWALCGHVSSKHLIGTKYECPDCSLKFPTLDIGLKHGISAHGNKKAYFKKVVFCNLCSQEISVQKDNYSHFTLVHKLDFPKEIPLLFDNEANTRVSRPPETTQDTSGRTSRESRRAKSVERPIKPGLSIPPRPKPRSNSNTPQSIANEKITPLMTTPVRPPAPAPPPPVTPTYTSVPQVFTQPATSYHPRQAYSASNEQLSYQQQRGTNHYYKDHQRRRKDKDDCVIL